MLHYTRQGNLMVDVSDKDSEGFRSVTFPNGDTIKFNETTFKRNFYEVENTSLKRKDRA